MLGRAVIVLALALSLVGCGSYEQPRYTVSQTSDGFEVRDYAPYVVAETAAAGEAESASDAAFRRLFDYIAGKNAGAQEISMTAPVTTTPQKIAMTAPVTQASRDGAVVMQFMMPSTYTLETLPKPSDPAVSLRAMPGKRVAVMRYSGSWSQGLYEEKLAALRSEVAKAGLETMGEPVWARYDPPFTPWFLRRNEVMLELAGG